MPMLVVLPAAEHSTQTLELSPGSAGERTLGEKKGSKGEKGGEGKKLTRRGLCGVVDQR
jgi:hypothetical protein